MNPIQSTDFVTGRGWSEPARPFLFEIGRVAAEFDQGELRALCIDGTEVVNRLYVAIRDVNWGTLPTEIREPSVHESRTHVTLEFTCSQSDDLIAFDWHGRLRLHAAGSVDYEFVGVATREFDYGRIGLNILIPARFAGLPYRIKTPAGFHGTLFPQGEVGAQPLIRDEYYPLEPAFTELTVITPHGELLLDLSGDLFEIEDQRNWTDNSFKIYSTPMTRASLHAEAGTRIQQRCRLVAPPPTPSAPRRSRSTKGCAAPVVTIGLSDSEMAAPQIGLVHTLPGQAPTEPERQLLSRLQLDHLRADVPGSAELPSKARSAAAIATDFGCELELAVHLEADSSEYAVDRVAETTSAIDNVRRILLFHDDAQVTPPQWTTRLRNALGRQIPVYGGTNIYFAEVNRARPDQTTCDGVAFSVNPQVHAFDDRSVMETVQAQRDVVRSAKCTFATSVPVAVTPVTLRPRFNPDAVVPVSVGATQSDQLPDNVDIRQASLFCAAWTVGSLKYLCEGGADSVTYFGTIGWEGVIERTEGSSLPRAFTSVPGGVYPCYHIFRSLGQNLHRRVVETHSSEPQSVVALAVRDSGETTIIIANLTTHHRQIELAGIRGPFRIRRLDKSTVLEAMRQPEAFVRAEEVGHAAPLAIGPYAVVICSSAQSTAAG